MQSTGMPASHTDPAQTLSLQTLIDHVGVYFYAKDNQGRYLFANQAVCTLYQASLTEVLGAPDHHFIDAQRSMQLLDNDRRVFQTGEAIHDEEEMCLLRGETRVFWTIKVPIFDAERRIVGLCGISTDITHRRRLTDAMVERNQLLSTILENIDSYVYLKDHEGRYLYANQKVTELYGRRLDDIVGRNDHDLLPAEEAVRLTQLDRQVLGTWSRHASEEFITDTHGQALRFWSIKLPLKLPGEPPVLIGFSTDITELMALRQDLALQRFTDPLSGLANRHQFESDLERELSVAARDQHQLAVVLLDLDQFKYINNSLGQAHGDQLIRDVAERLRAQGVPGRTLARLSGDEFVFTVPNVSSATDLMAAVEHVRAQLAQPYQLADRPFLLTVSAGISLYPADAQTGAALLSHAEAAMYFAKERGRDQCRFYARELGEAVTLRLELERDLRAALAAGEFELHYQPKISQADGGVAGFEALLRWNRQGHGQVSPVHFIPLAEQLGLLVPIGKWVVEEACRQSAQWRALGLPRTSIAVNLSPSQLNSDSLIAHVRHTLKAYAMADGELEMEVTESMMMDDPEQAIAILHALRQLGVRLSIDDFGTGYSSMLYLKRLPVDTLKLDRHFVSHIDCDERDASLCAGVIALAHTLGLQVVAEGVETASQHQALAARGCDLYQGYLFSRPLPADRATAYLQAQRPSGR